jgi:hypothetical protein
MGSVVAGSLFSLCQSAAMGGAAMRAVTGVGALGGVIAVGGLLASAQAAVGKRLTEALSGGKKKFVDYFGKSKARL